MVTQFVLNFKAPFNCSAWLSKYCEDAIARSLDYRSGIVPCNYLSKFIVIVLSEIFISYLSEFVSQPS